MISRRRARPVRDAGDPPAEGQDDRQGRCGRGGSDGVAPPSVSSSLRPRPILLSAILSPILTGELQGPLATLIAIIPVLITDIVWGLVCGAVALLIQVLRARRTRDADATR